MPSRPAAGRRAAARRLLLLLTPALALAIAPARASAASTCAAAGLTVTPLQSSVFYIDVGENYLGSYVGYRITNSGAAGASGLWVRLESFTGGVVGPASGAATSSSIPLDAIAAGASLPSYSYLKASAATAAAQAHDVVVYDGRPGSGGAEVCRQTQTITAVADVIKAAANKVTGASLSSATATLGSTFSLTVAGESGVIGAGPGDDPGIVRFSPAVAANWPSSAFRLVGVSHKLPLLSAPLPDTLFRTGLGGSANQEYSVTYTFRVVGPTSAPTPVNPVQNIASGTQVKHTDPGTLASLAPIPIVTSTTSLALTAGSPGPHVAGATVPLQVAITNTGSEAVSLDEVQVALPAGWSYKTGTAGFGGAPVEDPFVSGTTLRFVGPFAIPGNGVRTVALDATAGSASGQASAKGALAGGQIDSTVDPSDDAPATLALDVLGAPVAADDSRTVAAGTPISIAVLANDTLGGATPSLAVTQQPAHGSASVDGDAIVYTPDASYTGPDEFDYEVTTPGGASSATVSLEVAQAPTPPVPAPLASSGTGTAQQTVTVPVPAGGTATLLDGGGDPVTSIALPGVGTVSIDATTGVITFAPVLGFAGSAAPVVYEVTDVFGQTGASTYTPTVLAPAPPPAPPAGTTGIGTDPQSTTLPVPAGGTLKLLAPGGAEVTSVLVPGEGTYELDPATGAVTFTPVFGFAGKPSPVGYRARDAYGQATDGVYQPLVTPPAITPVPSAATTGRHDAAQSTTVPVPPGGSVTLLDAAGEPVTTVAIAGVGEYLLDPATGVITFTPAPGFAGTPPPVGYRITDAYGQASAASYQPAVEPAPTCVSKRKITLHWKVRKGVRLTRVRVGISGRPGLRLPGSAREAVIDMRGRRRETVTVTVRARAKGGALLANSRRYRTCTPGAARPPLPTLQLRAEK